MTFLAHPVPVVVDASVSVDLAMGQRPGIPELFVSWIAEDRMLLAPSIHWAETGHAILRQFGGDAIAAGRRLEIVAATGIETADRGPEGVRMAMALAERHRLSVYDATYLWLAIDIDGELATYDTDLARAAEAEGVPLAIPD
jgi:predicted nucleic acid-binding protein